MLPTRAPGEPTLADVLPSCAASLVGQPNPLGLPSVRKALVVLVDGLGVSSLRERRGHARALTAHLTKRSALTSGFPTTTAVALASLTTGSLPGAHGIVGYSALVPGVGVVNQLSGWSDRMRPATWQRSATVFETLAAQGVRSATIGPARYADSGLTHAILRGADYVSGASIADRFAAARALFDRDQVDLAYLYVPELDQLAHAKGWESDRWLAGLETLDAEFGAFERTLRRDEGVLVTADHGVVDVPASSHILFGENPALMAGVKLVGGEPRGVQLYLAPDARPADREEVAAAWHAAEGDRAWIATREQAVESGWYGEVAHEVLPRIGDVIVAARKLVAYYDGRGGDATGRGMIGQHGSLTAEESRVPLLRAGAFETA
ncbi:alkaline phosphatase family protein [Herbiconiux moechotypicola]|uniref:Alkaline phosphatase family protein n=1 Tax=Herbiconiux moechotypicola TaxID=637393 RepID=A0ABN3D6K7_9MICO|nr:nucleotide pyrophosphatase/phosphodiesterase family protein [Herbiconiux moechotypicola]MCS5728562.1 alkaline phosphatase family protein [Herbiconiux moechotypicola]